MDVQFLGSLLTAERHMPNSKYSREAMMGRGAVSENERLRRELERVSAVNRNLESDLARLRESHDDLSESALIWIRMYERQLDHANRLRTASAQEQTVAEPPQPDKDK
jgi:hypothetical protein